MEDRTRCGGEPFWAFGKYIACKKCGEGGHVIIHKSTGEPDYYLTAQQWNGRNPKEEQNG